MKAVDCHCHLDFEKFDGDRDKVVQRAKRKLEFVVSVGCTLDRNSETLAIADKYPEFVVPNLGIHPTYTEEFDRVEEVKRQIRDEDPAGIGEIGLDHHHVKDKSKRIRQEEVFREFLELAEELDKPVNIHSREAEREVINILKQYDLDALVHCFNGGQKLAREAVEEGILIGVTTQVLYSSHVQGIVKSLEIEDIVLETDSPFLYQGERNEPVNVLESAQKISELKDLRKEEIIRSTTANAEDIFQMTGR